MVYAAKKVINDGISLLVILQNYSETAQVSGTQDWGTEVY